MALSDETMTEIRLYMSMNARKEIINLDIEKDTCSRQLKITEELYGASCEVRTELLLKIKNLEK